MNENIIKEISKNLNIKENSVVKTLELLSEGNTIPFIARYRKEVTGSLDEEIIRQINEVYVYQVNLLKRKEDVIRLIEEKGLMTDEVKNKIMLAAKLVEVEDLYRPYKEKKKTKATVAIKLGLEPLAKIIMAGSCNNIDEVAKKYITDEVKTEIDAITFASHIIAEWISDNAFYRKWIRNFTFNEGMLTTKVKKNHSDENKTYEMYYDYSEKVKFVKPHRVLAINRATTIGVINTSITIDIDKIIDFLSSKAIKEGNSCKDIIITAIKDSYKRLIAPSIEREIRSELTEKASLSAISNFQDNLENLLLISPIKGKVVLGFDPAFRTGCKLAIVDEFGLLLKIDVIYPHAPINKIKEASDITLDLIKKYNVDLIAIGNGTASRESVTFIADLIKTNNLSVKYAVVNEAGASVYSASKLAQSEYPDLTVEKRSAISIARRLQDPLSELVKIDPESIGVGLYQHDVNKKQLSESLDFTVGKVVNLVGVNINTASPSLLKYVSGLSSKNVDKILNYKLDNGKISSREELLKKKVLTKKTYEQAIGFLRVVDGANIFDQTGIHPESYKLTIDLLTLLDLNIKDCGNSEFINKLNSINIEEYVSKLNTDIYTLSDIIEILKKPNRDYRDEANGVRLLSDILKIEDLKVGMKLEGTVRNVIDFGVFIDIGLKNDGLAHISKLTNRYIKHPSEVVSVGDIVTCYVDEIHMDKNKVSLSLLDKTTK